MNNANGCTPKDLPFDLGHRRFPITYSLIEETQPEEKREIKEALVKDLVNAISLAIEFPKGGEIFSDTDFLAAKRLWKMVNSDWLSDWKITRWNYPQYEERSTINHFREYLFNSEKPENKFVSDDLAVPHTNFTKAVAKYLPDIAIEMVPMPGNSERLIITAKATDRYIENYDQIYEKQVRIIEDDVLAIWEAWGIYVTSLVRYYPEIVDAANITGGRPV
ncbi:MAG: hypothetical protein C4523_11635 [Myxococcales bacterium]|nr:MAG: hypothetical protein C4523_11635 [Myxococcales bacterium]